MSTYRYAIPDGWMPSGRANGIDGHEAVCVLNTSDRPAHIEFMLFFENRDCMRVEGLTCSAQRTRHFRLDVPDELNGSEVPFDTPYAIVVDSDVPLTVQHTRVDVRGGALALMTMIAPRVEEQGP